MEDKRTLLGLSLSDNASSGVSLSKWQTPFPCHSLCPMAQGSTQDKHTCVQRGPPQHAAQGPWGTHCHKFLQG